MPLLSDETRVRIRRAVVAGWILICVFLLVRTLYLRHAPSKVWWDAEEVELLLMAALSGPTSFLPIWLYSMTPLGFQWWPYPGNDAKTIIVVWVCFFTAGCLQWFLLVPWLVHKGYDLFDYARARFRHRGQQKRSML